GDGAREGGFATLELPREAADDQPLVLELGRLDLSAQVLDMDAILREQSVVGELVRRVGEHLIDRGLAAEFLLGLGTHLVTLAMHAFPEKSSDRQVHRVIRDRKSTR